MLVFCAQAARKVLWQPQTEPAASPLLKPRLPSQGHLYPRPPSSFHPLEIRFPPQSSVPLSQAGSGAASSPERRGTGWSVAPAWCARKDLRATKHPAARSQNSLALRGSAFVGIRNPAGNERGADAQGSCLRNRPQRYQVLNSATYSLRRKRVFAGVILAKGPNVGR